MYFGLLKERASMIALYKSHVRAYLVVEWSLSFKILYTKLWKGNDKERSSLATEHLARAFEPRAISIIKKHMNIYLERELKPLRLTFLWQN
jgi:hypothetical protein